MSDLLHSTPQGQQLDCSVDAHTQHVRPVPLPSIRIDDLPHTDHNHDHNSILCISDCSRRIGNTGLCSSNGRSTSMGSTEQHKRSGLLRGFRQCATGRWSGQSLDHGEHRKDNSRIKSTVSQLEIDCSQLKSRTVDVSSLSKTNGQGNVLKHSSVPSPWAAIRPGTGIDAIRQSYCRNAF